MPAHDQRNVLRRATGATRPPAIGGGRGREFGRSSSAGRPRRARSDHSRPLSGPWHRPPITATLAGHSETVISSVGTGPNPGELDWRMPLIDNRLRLLTRDGGASSKLPCPRRLQVSKGGRKRVPNTATYCHFLAVIRGPEPARNDDRSVAKKAPERAFLDGSGSAMHNLMFASSRWNVVKLRGLCDQGIGPLREAQGSRTPDSGECLGLGWPGERRGRRCFRRQEGDHLLLRYASNNEKCGRPP